MAEPVITLGDSPDGLVPMVPGIQNTDSGKTQEGEELGCMEETRDIVRHMTRHALFTALLVIQLFLLPPTRFFIRLTSPPSFQYGQQG